MSAWVTLPHFLLVLVGAFLVGVRAYASTRPVRTEGDPDTRQLLRFASMASFGLFLLALILIAVLDFRMFHVARTGW